MSKVVVGGLLMSFVAMLLPFQPVDALGLDGADFAPGRIIDDAVFNDKDSMTVEQIQSFLEEMVPVCDTDGDKLRGGQTRAEYGNSRGYEPPYVCLRDYQQEVQAIENTADSLCAGSIEPGVKTGAKIIYDVAQACAINPQVLIVLLEKEQSLVRDDWPWPSQYRIATGYGCPDTAPCDEQYFGFFNQVYQAAKGFRRYEANPTWFNFRAERNNNIHFHPDLTRCGNSQVYIENQATANLYIYTPYQPNQAALNNLYGVGDSCSAYGNRNFWRLFNEWFGPPAELDNYWRIVSVGSGAETYLATSTHAFLISDQTIQRWGIGDVPVLDVPTSYIQSRQTSHEAFSLISDKFGNYFLVDNGYRHYVADPSLLEIWGMDKNTAVVVPGLVNSLKDGKWLSHCAESAQGEIFIVDGGELHFHSGSPKGENWGCEEATTPIFSDAFINSFSRGADYEHFVLSETGNELVISLCEILFDDGLSDYSLADLYKPSGMEAPVITPQLESLFDARPLSRFVSDADTGKWYMIGVDGKHYISAATTAKVWGLQEYSEVTNMASTVIGSIPDGDNLSRYASATSSGKHYLLDGSSNRRLWLSTDSALKEWSKGSESFMTISDQEMQRFREQQISSPLVSDSDGGFYLMQSGVKHRINNDKVSAWGISSDYNMSRELSLSIESGQYLDTIVSSTAGEHYLIDGVSKHLIDEAAYSSWGIDHENTLKILPVTLDRFRDAGDINSSYFNHDGGVFVVNGQFAKKVPKIVSDNLDAEGSLPSIASLSAIPFFARLDEPVQSHLVKSDDASNFWLVGASGLYPISSATAINLGYLSQDVKPVELSPKSIAELRKALGSDSLLIRNSVSGALKLVSFGRGYSLPHADIVVAYANVTNSVLDVDSELFDKFEIGSYATRLVKDDDGKIYWIDGGKKRWILNGALMDTVFNGVGVTYFESTIMTQIPTGAPIF